MSDKRTAGKKRTGDNRPMKKILFASGSKKNIEALTGIAEDLPAERTGTALRAAEAGRMMESGEFSLLVVNTPLEDSQGIDLCVSVREKLMYPVMLLTNEVTAGRIREDMEKRSILLFSRPVEKKTFNAALRALDAAGSILEQLRIHNQTLQNQLEEIRLINRAKAYLIRDMGMTESRAHKFIEKQAMDLRITKAAVAQNILKTYYNK